MVSVTYAGCTDRRSEDIDPYYRLTPAQVEDLKNDLKSSDKESRLEAAHYIAKFVLEPAQVLIDYITQGDCIESLTVRN